MYYIHSLYNICTIPHKSISICAQALSSSILKAYLDSPKPEVSIMNCVSFLVVSMTAMPAVLALAGLHLGREATTPGLSAHFFELPRRRGRMEGLPFSNGLGHRATAAGPGLRRGACIERPRAASG